MKKKTAKRRAKKISKRKSTTKRKIFPNPKKILGCKCFHNPEPEYGRFGPVERLTFNDVKHILNINGLGIEKLNAGYRIYDLDDSKQRRFSYDLGGALSEGMSLRDLKNWKVGNNSYVK